MERGVHKPRAVGSPRLEETGRLLPRASEGAKASLAPEGVLLKPPVVVTCYGSHRTRTHPSGHVVTDPSTDQPLGVQRPAVGLSIWGKLGSKGRIWVNRRRRGHLAEAILECRVTEQVGRPMRSSQEKPHVSPQLGSHTPAGLLTRLTAHQAGVYSREEAPAAPDEHGWPSAVFKKQKQQVFGSINLHHKK